MSYEQRTFSRESGQSEKLKVEDHQGQCGHSRVIRGQLSLEREDESLALSGFQSEWVPLLGVSRGVT